MDAPKVSKNLNFLKAHAHEFADSNQQSDRVLLIIEDCQDSAWTRADGDLFGVGEGSI